MYSWSPDRDYSLSFPSIEWYSLRVKPIHSPDRDLHIGSFVRRRRIAARLTQQQLADLAGVAQRFVSELERGKPTVRLSTVNKVLRVFGKQVGIEDLSREERR